MPVLAIVLLLSGCAGVAKFPRFDELCRTAGLMIDRRPQQPVSVLLDRSESYPPNSERPGPGYSFLPTATGLVSQANVSYVDELTSTGTRYRRYFQGRAPNVETETDAELLLRVRHVATAEEVAAGITGYETTLIDRKTGQVLSSFRYFFTEQPFYFCPTTREGRLIVSGTVAVYMIGLRDPSKEELYKRNYLPAPKR